MKHNLSETPLWEKIIGLMGLLLICFTIGYLLWSAFSNDNDPPDIHFNVVSIEALGQQYLVLVDVKNMGDKTPSDLHLEARLSNSDGLIQRSSIQVSYLAANSTQRVGFFFASDPTKGELTFRPIGYLEP